MKWNYIAESVREEQRKGKGYSKETSDQGGLRIHHFRGDLTSSNQVLTIGSKLRHSNR